MSGVGTYVKQVGHRVELLGSIVHVDSLDVPLNEAADYLRGLPPEKWELAFAHAVQVGMFEIMSRRRRFRSRGSEPAADELQIQRRTTPLNPMLEVGAERPYAEHSPFAATLQESDEWLKCLDEEFECLNKQPATDSETMRRR